MFLAREGRCVEVDARARTDYECGYRCYPGRKTTRPQVLRGRRGDPPHTAYSQRHVVGGGERQLDCRLRDATVGATEHAAPSDPDTDHEQHARHERGTNPTCRV